MAFFGKTTHFSISYDDSLVNGAALATELLAHCEADFDLMSSWFPGTAFEFSFPLPVQIANQGGGASWVNPSDGLKPFFEPTVVLGGLGQTGADIRYLLVCEVTEMFMASQRKGWFEPTDFFNAGDEGSMGEALSRFLGVQFLLATGAEPTILSGFSVVPDWLNSTDRGFALPPGLNPIDTAPDDNMPDATTGCATCFLFFLHDQLGFSINQIIAAGAPTLAIVHTILTGNTNGFTTFLGLVDSHYPQDGTQYFPPMDNIFPLAELRSFTVPPRISWVSNGPQVAYVFLTQPLPVNVNIALTSEDPSIISVPSTLTTTSFASFVVLAKPQPSSVMQRDITLTATYAGRSISAVVRVVRPEELIETPLKIAPVDTCAYNFLAGTALQLEVTNINVFTDQAGLSYKWRVTGAAITVNDDPVLTIPQLPGRGARVSVNVTVTNAGGVGATGAFQFTVLDSKVTLNGRLRVLDCHLRQLASINPFVPPWVPVEEGDIKVSVAQLTKIVAQAEKVAAAAKSALDAKAQGNRWKAVR